MSVGIGKDVSEAGQPHRIDIRSGLSSYFCIFLFDYPQVKELSFSISNRI
jgi:hypothetical protein